MTSHPSLVSFRVDKPPVLYDDTGKHPRNDSPPEWGLEMSNLVLSLVNVQRKGYELLHLPRDSS